LTEITDHKPLDAFVGFYDNWTLLL